MNILIDIGHPAHVHNFRNLAKKLEEGGHKVVWSVKDIPVALRLLDFYGFKYYVLSAKKDSLISKIIKQLKYNYEVWRICKKEKIELAIGTSVSIAHVSKFSKVKSIMFDDDDDQVQAFVTKYVHPYVDTLLTPEAIKQNRKKKGTVFYKGYHELAYLHPSVFEPDPSVLGKAGLKEEDTFFIMRFNVFKAHHDVGIHGLTLNQKLEIVNLLKPYGKILITTEREIEPELAEYQLKVEPENIHSLMAYASMFVGDSQTMITEAAIIGTPAIKCNSFAGKLSVPNEIEQKYGLCYSYLPEEFSEFKAKIKDLLSNDNLKEEWAKRKAKLLEENINVTDFWTWFVASYPESRDQYIKDSEYQKNFK
jgi:predicted glycosyltransferase